MSMEVIRFINDCSIGALPMECTLRALMTCTGVGGRVVAEEEGWQVGSRTDVIRNEMVREKVFERETREICVEKAVEGNMYKEEVTQSHV